MFYMRLLKKKKKKKKKMDSVGLENFQLNPIRQPNPTSILLVGLG